MSARTNNVHLENAAVPVSIPIPLNPAATQAAHAPAVGSQQASEAGRMARTRRLGGARARKKKAAEVTGRGHTMAVDGCRRGGCGRHGGVGADEQPSQQTAGICTSRNGQSWPESNLII